MFGALIRRIGFWFLDFVKGGKIHKHYKEIEKCMKENDVNVQENKVIKLLEHAKNTTTYYKDVEFKSIKDFPVINKLTYKNNFDDFQSSEYKDKKIHTMSTSGSTGTPFVVRQDMNKRYRTLADIVYYNKISGQNLGQKYIFFRVWTDKNRKSKLERWKQNLIPIDILHLDDKSLEEMRQVLKKDKTINSTLAYASTYENLVNYLERCGDTKDMFNIKTMFSSSELLTDETKAKIKNIIGADVVDRYSNQENGILAQSCKNGNEFHVNTASYYVELLKLDSDEEAEDGELSRIVITDLYNYAMPMIRYDTGDLAIKKSKSDCGWNTQVIKSIQGRQVDVIYDTKGEKLTPHTWSVYMWKFNKLKQYQFIQKDKNEYVMKLNMEEGTYTEEEIINHLKSVLGEDANIKIELVDEIPVLASGKFKKTVCEFKPKK